MRLSAIPVVVLACTTFARGEISPEGFRHHYIARELPGENTGTGTPIAKLLGGPW